MVNDVWLLCPYARRHQQRQSRARAASINTIDVYQETYVVLSKAGSGLEAWVRREVGGAGAASIKDGREPGGGVGMGEQAWGVGNQDGASSGDAGMRDSC